MCPLVVCPLTVRVRERARPDDNSFNELNYSNGPHLIVGNDNGVLTMETIIS